HQDERVAQAVRRGRIREFAAFGWDPAEIPDPQDPATFQGATLRWDEIDREPHREMLAWHRRLIALRRATPALRDGRLEAVDASADDARGVLIVRRGPVTLYANLGAAPVTLTRPAGVPRLEAGGASWDAGRVALPADALVIFA
ncbi:MAG TPA: DUF3459 domain-containing protein, partial [Candidatus Limnocylindrales bacterium]|nr:DUF3459 domain-containing protein [Candidatus Limnocylindrales bacterium]